MIFTSSTLLQL